ncbi:MAG: cell division protein FtsB [Alphaproteobacteria bacterium]|jgi:cell division protein FtsB
MKLFVELKNRANKLLFPFLVLLVLVYTYYQMLTGDRGLVVWYDLNAQVEDITTQNLALAEQVSLTDVKINRLKGATLDPDYIDEQIRKNLPRMHKNETVIFLK